MEEREEGEISGSDSDACEDVDVYNPILRPVSSVLVPRVVESSILSSDNESPSSASDSDSDLEQKPKRRKTNYKPMEVQRNGGESNVGKAKKNNIWANVLQEEELTLEIGGVGLKKLRGDRNVENYDYSQALKVYENNKNDDFEFEETEEDKQKRLNRKRKFLNNFEDKKKEKKYIKPRYLANIVVEPDWDSDKLGNVIADALFEQKPELIVRVVQVLGQEKALELYRNTQKTEEEGGMMINNGSRRRTSGGVFLNLLKTLEDVSSEQIQDIFDEDQKVEQLWRKRMKASRRRRKKEALLNDGDECVNKVEEDGLHLKGLFSDDPGGTKCPGSTPVTSPTTSDNDEIESSNSKIKFLPLKEVCERAASEIFIRDQGENLFPETSLDQRQDDMETC